MDPTTIAVVTASAMVPLLKGPLLESATQAAWKLLKERLTTAKEQYEAKPLEKLTPTLETNRRRRLDELSELQTRAILQVSTPTLLQKILAMSVELTAEAYEADVEQDLDSIGRRSEQLKSFLDREARERKYRSQVRVIAVVVSVILFIGLFALAIFGPHFGLEVNYVIPILQIPLSILFWSAIGSFTSLLYRFNRASDVELQDPLRWLITRPLTGIVMGTVAYLTIRTGFLSAGVEDVLSATTNELIWLVAFLVGFSDRFSEGLLKSLVGRLGGDKDADLVTSPSSPGKINLAEILQPLSKITEKIKRGEESSVSIDESEDLDAEFGSDKESAGVDETA